MPKECKKEIMNNLVAGIDVIEFFDAEDGDKNRVEMDQLSNLPSFIASKTNMTNVLSNKILDLNARQLYRVNRIAVSNTVKILNDMLISNINSNFKRFIDGHKLIPSGYNSGKKIDDHIMMPCPYGSDEWLKEENKRVELLYNYDNYALCEMIHSCLTASNGNSLVHSSYSDSEPGVKNTVSTIDMFSSQIYIYISSCISFNLDKFISYIYAPANVTSDMLDYLTGEYPDDMSAMRSIMKTVGEAEFIPLFVKNIVSIDLYRWFNDVLRPIVYNTMMQSGKTGYYVYNDYRISLKDDPDKIVDIGKF